MSQLPAPALIIELEARHDEAMQSLTELELRIEAVLAQFGGASPASAKTSKPGRKGSTLELAASEQTPIELKLHQPAEVSADEKDSAAA